MFSVVFAFVLSLGLVRPDAGHHAAATSRPTRRASRSGLDRTEHDEVGFDFSAATESVAVVATEPRPATVPRGNGRFDVQLTGADAEGTDEGLDRTCASRAKDRADADFLAVYPLRDHDPRHDVPLPRRRPGGGREAARRRCSHDTLGKDVHRGESVSSRVVSASQGSGLP